MALFEIIQSLFPLSSSNSNVMEINSSSRKELIKVVALEHISVIGEIYHTDNGMKFLNFSQYLLVPRKNVSLRTIKDRDTDQFSIQRAAGWYVLRFKEKKKQLITLKIPVMLLSNQVKTRQKLKFPVEFKATTESLDPLPKNVKGLSIFLRDDREHYPELLHAIFSRQNFINESMLCLRQWRRLEVMTGSHLLAARIADLYGLRDLAMPDARRCFADEIKVLFQKLKRIDVAASIKNAPTDMAFSCKKNNGRRIVEFSLDTDKSLCNRIVDCFSFRVRAQSYLTEDSKNRRGLEKILFEVPGCDTRNLFNRYFGDKHKMLAFPKFPKSFPQSTQDKLIADFRKLENCPNQEQVEAIINRHLSKSVRKFQVMSKMINFVEIILSVYSDVSIKRRIKLIEKLFNLYRDDSKEEYDSKCIRLYDKISRWFPNLSLDQHKKIIPSLFCHNRFDVDLTEKTVIDVVSKRSGISGTYSPKIMKLIIEYLRGFPDEVGEIKRVFDPSAGWGSRMIGAAAANVEEYFGVDPNPDMEEPYNEIINFLKNVNEEHRTANYRVLKAGVETPEAIKAVMQVMEEFDLGMSCPQYFNRETYKFNDPAQSINKNPIYQDWLQEFLVDGIIRQNERALRVGGIFALHLENAGTKENPYPIADDFVEIMAKDFSHVFKPFGMIAAHPQRSGGVHNSPIYLYQKKASKGEKRQLDGENPDSGRFKRIAL